MKKLLLLLSVTFLMVLTITYSCKKNDQQPLPDPNEDVMSYTGNKGEIGQAGGSIEILDNSELNNTKIEVPQGALDGVQQIEINETEVPKVFLNDTLSVAVQLLPEGLVFNKPVKITMPFPKKYSGTEKINVWYYNEKDSIHSKIEDVTINTSNKTITFETNHFSIFYSTKGDIDFAISMGNWYGKPAASISLANSFEEIPVSTDFLVSYASNLSEFLTNSYSNAKYITEHFVISLMKKNPGLGLFDKELSTIERSIVASYLVESQHLNFSYRKGDPTSPKGTIYYGEASPENNAFLVLNGLPLIFVFEDGISISSSDDIYLKFTWQFLGSQDGVKYSSAKYETTSERRNAINSSEFNNFNVLDANEDYFKDLYQESKLTVTTTEPTDITSTSATVGGNVTSDGNSTVTERGIYYGTSQNPENTGTKVSIGNGTGTFSKTLTGLSADNTYYVKAYAKNSTGVAYGTQKQFKTSETQTTPTVVTDDATDVTDISATLHGNITSDGNATITERGFYISKTDANVDSNDSKSVVTGTTGSFSLDVTGMDANTDFYFRAFATNSMGTSVGEVKSFRTESGNDGNDVENPVVTIISPTENETVSGTISFKARATDNVGVEYVEFSIAVNNSWQLIGTDNTVSGDNEYSVDFNTEDYVNGTYAISTAAYDATGNHGYQTFYNITIDNSSEPSGETGTLTDSRDDHVYKTVKIGEQWWMAENLAYLPAVSPASEGSDASPYYYVYDYNGTDVSAAKATANYTTYGVLYNWPAAMAGAASSSSNPSGVQGVCPDGWHLPSDAEWKQLEMAIGMSQSEADGTGYRGTNEGTKLKATSGWNNNGNGTDEVGFSARPGGYRSYNGGFYYIGHYGYWWSATEIDSYYAWSRYLSYSSTKVYRDSYYGGSGFSVRCVRD